MTTNYHTPISNGTPANAGVFNGPLAELDAAISALVDALPVHDHTDDNAGGRLPFDALDVDDETIGDVLTIVDVGSGVKRVRAMPPATGGGSIPAGILTDYAGDTAPPGWLLCAGQAVSRATYADLFTAIGTTYGVGDGSTTFNLPDLRGRTGVGKDDMGGTSANRITAAWADNLGGSGGAETHTLITGEMPSHQHAIFSQGRWGTGTAPVGFAGITITGTDTNASSVGASNTTNNGTSLVGSDGAHNNIQPSIALNKIIKT